MYQNHIYSISTEGGLTMPYVERTDEEIIQAWERLLEADPTPDKIYIVVGLRTYTFRQIVQALKEGDKTISKVYIVTLRRAAQEDDKDPIEIDEIVFA